MHGSAASNRLLFASVGLAQGWVYWRLAGRSSREALSSLLIGVFVSTVVVVVQFAWTGRHVTRLLALACALAAPLTAVTWWVMAAAYDPHHSHGTGYRMFSWAIASPLIVYVLLPFIQVIQEGGRFRFPYPDLFRHSWDNFFIAFVASTFAAVFWGLIGLWGVLFTLVGVDFFSRVFFSQPFVMLASGAISGTGVAIGRETETITNLLRRVTLAQFRALVPMLVAIVLLFLAALPVTGVEPLWATRHASPILLVLVCAVVLFVNAVVQDGERDPGWIRRGLEAMILGTPVLCGLLCWAIGLRIAQYGLMPDRVYAIVLSAIASLYALGYAVAVLRRGGPWLAFLQRTNVVMALVVAAVALLLHTPVLDPLALSARSQERRLLRGAVSPGQFDYGALAGLGTPGREVLERLDELGHPQATEILARVTNRPPAKAEKLSEDHIGLMGSIQFPDGLLDAIQSSDEYVAAHCEAFRDCSLFAVDAVVGGEAEYCVYGAGKDLVCWERAHEPPWKTKWNRRYFRLQEPRGGVEDMFRALKYRGPEVVAKPNGELRIGRTMYRLAR